MTKTLTIQPRGMSQTDAARYVGVGVGLFKQWVADGIMPAPSIVYGEGKGKRLVYDRHQIDEAFDRKTGKKTEQGNPFDAVEW